MTRVLESNVLRGNEGATFHALESYGVTPPSGPAWSYDFTAMADGLQPATLITIGGSVDGAIVSGHYACNVDWFFTRNYDTLIPDQVATTHLMAAEVVYPRAGSAAIDMRFAANTDLSTYNGVSVNQTGAWSGQYHNGGDGGSGNVGALAINTPIKFVVTYNETTGAWEIFIDGVSRGTSSFTNIQTGPRCGFQIGGNLDVWIRKLYYGPQSAGVPT